MNEGNRTVRLMGTIIKLWIQHDQPEPLLDEAVRRLADYEQRFSANGPSHLTTLNQQAGKQAVALEKDLFELIQLGKQHSLPQDSFLNIAIGPLTSAWHIGFKDAKHPSEAQIKELLTTIQPENIVLDEAAQTVYLPAQMSIDLGALAKGYFADCLLAYFQSEGVETAMIDLGGNLLVHGDAVKRADTFWRVGIQDPFQPRGKYRAILKIKNQSVVTSGIYERANTFEGKTYHHIFDSKTGYPIETNIASLTIVSEQSVDGEIWTTRLFGHPVDKILEKLEEVEGVYGLVITKDEQVYYSKELAERIIWM